MTALRKGVNGCEALTPANDAKDKAHVGAAGVDDRYTR
jgi:hypothetical protein